jgi:hypothetical protein
MSEMTIESVDSQTKILAVHAAAPDADREKVMLLEPSFRSRAFYDCQDFIETKM